MLQSWIIAPSGLGSCRDVRIRTAIAGTGQSPPRSGLGQAPFRTFAAFFTMVNGRVPVIGRADRKDGAGWRLGAGTTIAGAVRHGSSRGRRLADRTHPRRLGASPPPTPGAAVPHRMLPAALAPRRRSERKR